MQTLHKGNKIKKRFLSLLQGLFLFLGINLNAFTYNIVDGDQMLGAVENISDFTPFQNKCVNFIYYIDFQNGEQYYVRNINAVVSGYPLLTQLNKGQGFILNASGSCSVTTNAQEEIIFQGLTYKTIQSPTTNKIWLDRNLGATKVCDKKRSEFNNATDYINSQESCFGNYYQWGRKTDGHQLATSIVTTNFQTSITNTNSQFSTNMNGLDWVEDDTSGSIRENYWKNSYGVGTAVCPSGFRVPTASDWEAEIPNLYNALADVFKLPYSGYRSSSYGNLLYRGNFIQLWSTTPYIQYGVAGAKAFYFSDSYIGTGDSTSYSDRANGFNVRCIKK